MLEKFLDRATATTLVIMFFVCVVVYNIGYFSAVGGSMRYFFFVPTSFFDVVKSGLGMAIPLLLILLIFKPILINPVFSNSFPSASILLAMAIAVLVSNFLYFSIFSDSQNRLLALISEVSFYLFALVCFVAIVYYFLNNISPQYLIVIFFLSVVSITFLIGVVDAKIGISSSYKDVKSQILLKNDKVINANILRSVDKGIFIIIGNASSIDFIAWDESKGVKYRKVSVF